MRALFLSLTILVLTLGQIANAGGPPSRPSNETKEAESAVDDPQRAERLFREGRAAQERGDCNLALDLFRESHRMVPGRGKRVNIAVCEKDVGQLAAALRHFHELLTELDVNDRRRPLVEQNITVLEPWVPSLKLVLAANAPPNTVVRYDNGMLGQDVLGSEMKVDPGKHTIVVSADRFKDKAFEVDVKVGTNISVEIGPGEPIPQLLIPKVTVRQIQEPVDVFSRRRNLMISTGAVGVVGLMSAATMGIFAFSTHIEALELCPDQANCSRIANEKAQTSTNLSIAGGVALAAGLLGSGASLALLFYRPKLSAQTFGLSVSPARSQVFVVGRF